MKIIHCADVHLDSRLSANLDDSKAKMRREEILNTFLRMIDYGAEQGVEAILIAGDLFDTMRVRASVRNAVESAIRKHPDIQFYLLRGNHEASGFLDALETVPENLKLFGEEWTSYVLNPSGAGNIVLTGAELTAGGAGLLYSSLVLDNDHFNIVMLHGQQNNYMGKNQAETIALGELRNKGIDYLALGHVHEYHMEELDKRGKWCYSGCLEGRGFDECGEHGFVLLDIDEESLTYKCEMIPFAGRKFHVKEVDVTGCMDSSEMADVIGDALAQSDFHPKDMVKVVLTGQVDVSCEKNLEFMTRRLEDLFFFIRLYDETKLSVDYDSFLLDESLKGEFVRQVQAAGELDQETKLTIIRYGLQALAGEDIE
jgi:DNA repair exonuclease SbcCD nuclease subunit